jgi:hypothetical protein
MAGKADMTVLECVAREEEVRDEEVHAVICGHTYSPAYLGHIISG